MKTGNFVVRNMGELMEDIFDLKNIPRHGLELEISFLKIKYLITREKIKGKIYTILWEETAVPKKWEEQARAINPYFIARILDEYATSEGGRYYEISDDKFTRMEGL